MNLTQKDERPYEKHSSACQDCNTVLTDEREIVKCLCRPCDGTRAPDAYELWWCPWCGQEASEGSDPCQECGEPAQRRKYVAVDALLSGAALGVAAQAEHSHADHRHPSGSLTRWSDLTEFQMGQFRNQALGTLRAAVNAATGKDSP